MAVMAAAKDRDEVTATPPTPKTAREGEATPERRSAPAAAASPRGDTPGAAHSPAASPATGHAGTAGTPRARGTTCWLAARARVRCGHSIRHSTGVSQQ